MIKNITFNKDRSLFQLETSNTSYAFLLVANKYLEHVYYGAKSAFAFKELHSKRLAFSTSVKEFGKDIYFNSMPSEIPFFGTGDFRSDSLRLQNARGNSATLFTYDSHRIFKGRQLIEKLPFARADDNTETLEITLLDDLTKCTLKLYYSVFYDCDVISRHMILENNGGQTVKIKNAKSLCLDINDKMDDLITLVGAHFNERSTVRHPLNYGKHSIYSTRGISSHNFNPFLAVCQSGADYLQGKVAGFNLIYSGSFENSAEKTGDDCVRVQIGANGDCEETVLQKNDRFFTPEAIMTYSENGIGQMSRNFHKFTKGHIIQPYNLNRHPVVLNTWEAFYFDINETKLLSLAKEAKDVGIEMLVVDDGWFSSRNNDKSGLGDWRVNLEKFPSGLAGFSRKIQDIGLELGIWIEPEMVNPDSELFKAHPEWCLNCYGRPLSLSRNQLVLNMSEPAVIEYLKESFINAFDGVVFSYVKWDMNRSLSMVGGNTPFGCGEENLYRRYVEGVYELFDWFQKAFPNIMIENCCGGGGRYDLGMMRYSSQIWTSDNTFPKDRLVIQSGSLIAYPACVMSCHVSNFQNACNDPEELDFRFKVASMGVLGYEMDLLAVGQDVKDAIREQIKCYNQIKPIVLEGEYYPVTADKDLYVSYYFKKSTGEILIYIANPLGRSIAVNVKIPEADSALSYRDVYFGDIYKGIDLKNGIEYKTQKKMHSVYLKAVSAADKIQH